MGSSIEETASSVAKRILESDSLVSSYRSTAATVGLAAMQQQAQQRAALFGGLESSAAAKLSKQINGLAANVAAINSPSLRAVEQARAMFADRPSALLSSFASKIPDSYVKTIQAINLQNSGINAAINALKSQNSMVKQIELAPKTMSLGILSDVKHLLGEPLSSFTKQIEAMNAAAPANSMRHVMEALRAPSMRMSENIASISQSSPSYMSEVLAALNEPARKFSEQMSALQELHKRSAAAQYAFVNNRIGLEGIDSFAAGEIEIRPSTEEEIALNAFTKSGDYKDCIKVMNVFINQGQVNPSFWLNPWVVGIFIALISSIINPIVEDAWKHFSNSVEPMATKKEARKLVSDVMRIDCFNVRKLVTKNGIAVRASTSANAKVLSHLRCWDSVIVQETRKDWSLVSWTDSTGKINIQGWVFSRYLSKPNQL
ncbi:MULTISPECIES: hypothetical protein [Deefgea]|uniref:SH3 domain-containing protein n=1 Tax=Deefgea chitinilytica TaxID=570276 RepID=A0ABS2CAN6_9NEIS|nr:MULTISPECIES: hypothetical protein [Deefgea]MBM5570730.1 hypothetical protein [Deefgea chitinilytica]MBM9887959.1 hypothetical protein [Deefgea sp. CFH1-16]